MLPFELEPHVMNYVGVDLEYVGSLVLIHAPVLLHVLEQDQLLLLPLCFR